MATLEIAFLHNQLEERKRRLEAAMALSPQQAGLAGLLREVDSALERMAQGTYGICHECHESIEQDRLLTDPLVCYCLDHLTPPQRDALQRDLDLAAQVQRNLLPRAGLIAGGWETSYHYAPFGPVSGDYCDLIPSDGQLFFVLGDVSGKGVAASMLMAQLHALFRSLTGLSLGLGQMVAQANLLGNAEMVRERIQAYKNVGVTRLRVAPMGHNLHQKIATLSKVMDLVEAVNAQR